MKNEKYYTHNQLMAGTVYIIIDESDISGKRYFNTLVGRIDNPEKTCLFDYKICDFNINYQYILLY